MNNSEGFVRSHFCVPLRMSPCLTRFCISNVTTSSRTTYVFSDSVEQRNRTMSCCYSASARLRECSCTPVSCSGGRGPLLLPEFSKALDTPPLQGELLEVETMPCLLLNPWCPAPHLAHRTCSDGYMGTLMSSWTPRSRVQNGFVISLPSPPNPLLPETFPFLFIKDPSSQLQRSKSPWEYCTVMERAVIVVRLFWARILALATTGCPVWMSCLPLLSVSFPFLRRRMTIHS